MQHEPEEDRSSGLTLRILRISAALVNLAPTIAPAFPLASALAAGEGRGMGGQGLLFVFGAWCLASTLLVLLINAVLLVHQKQTVGLAYFGLVAECARAGRMLLADAALLLAPLLGGVVASRSSDDAETSSAILLSVPALCWLANWLFWLGPSQRTLADRLGGCRVRPLPVDSSDLAQMRSRRPVWPDVLLLGPLFLWLPAYGGIRGAVAGGAIGALVLGLPLALTRRRK